MDLANGGGVDVVFDMNRQSCLIGQGLRDRNISNAHIHRLNKHAVHSIDVARHAHSDAVCMASSLQSQDLGDAD